MLRYAARRRRYLQLLLVRLKHHLHNENVWRCSGLCENRMFPIIFICDDPFTLSYEARDTCQLRRLMSFHRVIYYLVAPNPYLCLFPSPKVVVPSFELTRRVGTFLSQGIYQLWYEKAYNLERFILAANEGTSVIGECIANEEWSRMSVVASAILVEQAKLARRRLVIYDVFCLY
ncbi:hypothetical protein OSTOST_22496 [Ostertagia ostertagi]